MTYVAPILIFLMVLSPLYIPVGVTVAHAIMTWHRRLLAMVARSSDRRGRVSSSRGVAVGSSSPSACVDYG